MVGAVGGPKWDAMKIKGDPEDQDGLMCLRKKLDTFFGIRPIKYYKSLHKIIPFYRKNVQNSEIIILREMCGGVMFSKPRGIKYIKNQRYGFDTAGYYELEIKKFAECGFELAKKASEVFDKNPNVKGLILLNHGIFTFANNAKESYERMIKYITKAEKELTKKSKFIRVSKYVEKKISISEISNLIRQQIANKRGDDFERNVVHFNKPKFLFYLRLHLALQIWLTKMKM